MSVKASLTVCSYMRKRWVEDEVFHYCEFTDTMCIRNSGNVECEIYSDLLNVVLLDTLGTLGKEVSVGNEGD